MKTKQQIVLKQIKLQEKIQLAGFNIIECGNCGTVLLHECGDEEIDCFCGHTMDLSSCPDLYYSGMETNAEFQDEKFVDKFISFDGINQNNVKL